MSRAGGSPLAMGPQGADRGDRLDLTTSEELMTATELGQVEVSRTGLQPDTRMSLILAWEAPLPIWGVKRKSPHGKSRFQYEHFRFKVSLVVQFLVRRRAWLYKLLLHLHPVPDSLHST